MGNLEGLEGEQSGESWQTEITCKGGGDCQELNFERENLKFTAFWKQSGLTGEHKPDQGKSDSKKCGQPIGVK